MKYCDIHGRVIAESDSPIKFNLTLFPTFANLEIIDEVKSTKKNKKTALDKDNPEEEKL